MADHSIISQVEVLSVTDTGRRRRWTDAEKLRIVEESYAAPRLTNPCLTGLFQQYCTCKLKSA